MARGKIIVLGTRFTWDEKDNEYVSYHDEDPFVARLEGGKWYGGCYSGMGVNCELLDEGLDTPEEAAEAALNFFT